MGHPARRAELLFDHDIGADIAADVEAAFRNLGFVTEVRRRFPHRGPEELTWLMLAALPLQAFLSGIGAEAVKDVYAKAKQLTVKRKPSNQVPLVLQDTESDVKVILEADLPAEAIRQLVGLDLGAYRIGPLHYDRTRKAWRSELDEAEG